MIKRSLFTALCVVLLTNCTAPSNSSASATKKLKPLIGWVDGSCFALKEMAITSDATKRLTVRIIASDTKARHTLLSIHQKTQAGDACSSATQERISANSADGYIFYTLNEPSVGQELAQVINEATTENLSASYCTTQEGLNGTVSQGGKLLWKGYYYLGYDLEPSC